MRKKYLFKSDFIPTEESYRDFNQTWRFRLRIFYFLFIMIFTIFIAIGIISKKYDFSFQLGCYELLLMLFILFVDYNINNYKRLKVQYGDEIPVFETMFFDDNIVVQTGKNKMDYKYNIVQEVIDGDNLMILKLPYRMGIIVEKNSMGKREVNKLKEFLLQKCNVKCIKRVPSKIYVLKHIAWICALLSFCITLVLFITR